MYKTHGNKIERILNLLRHKTRTAREIINELTSTNPDTYKVTKRLLGHMDVPKFNYATWKREEEKKFYMLLAKLRREGLIEKHGLDGKTAWKLTKDGIKKLIKYAEIKPECRVLPNKEYTKKKINDKILIIFDIPEKLRGHRAWLRRQLNTLDFTKLQQSVWIGNCAVPSDFIHDLKEINLLRHIHIFRISESGSIIE